jgi:hypothetical protein
MHVVNYNTRYESLKNAVDKPDGLAVLAVMFEVSELRVYRYRSVV